MIRIYTVFISLLLINSALAQPSIKGKVVSAESNQPIAGASVFISNTSRGTVTNTTGEFSLNDIPAGTHELVVSFVGFETFVKSFNPNELPMNINIKMKLKVKELEGVTVAPFEKDGWAKWGRVFMENFIGTTGNADNCKIINYKTIRFRFSKKDNILTAVAAEPLIIQNKSLGYSIQYQLEDFEINYKENSMAYYGYPLFEEMKGGKKKWKLARQKAYLGSVNHFIRCVYDNSLAKEGFDVKRLRKVPNYEKERVKTIYKVIQKNVLDKKTGKATIVMGYNDEQFSADTVGYYQQIMQQQDYFDVYSDYLVTADSITALDSARNKYLLFPDYIAVTYKNETEEQRYLHHIMEANRKPFYQRSSLTLTGNGFVSIEKNGSYYSPQDLFTNGYWGWSEKMASLLPLDYELNE
jgi:hypothetical protein